MLATKRGRCRLGRGVSGVDESLGASLGGKMYERAERSSDPQSSVTQAGCPAPYCSRTIFSRTYPRRPGCCRRETEVLPQTGNQSQSLNLIFDRFILANADAWEMLCRLVLLVPDVLLLRAQALWGRHIKAYQPTISFNRACVRGPGMPSQSALVLNHSL